MPLHRTIGLSLALIVMSAGANAQTATKSTPQDPVHTAKPEAAHSRAARARARHETVRRAQPRRMAHARAPQHPIMLASAEASAKDDGPPPAGVRGAVGMAAWYDLTGRRTASGERFDRATMTAAHRTLPLFSRARVTNLENGRSVVVEINDRGPWKRGLMIDLSAGAARRLEMIGAGLARVAVEPLGGASPGADEPQLALNEVPTAGPANAPLLVAYHPDAPAAAEKPKSDPPPQQDAWLEESRQGSQ